MNRFQQVLAVLILMVASAPISAQQASSQNQSANPGGLVGGVESVGGRLQLNLTNTDPAREFRGTVHVSLGSPAQQAEAARLTLVLAPQETRLIPIGVSAASGGQCTLNIYNQAGALVYFKTAPIQLVAETDLAAANSASVKAAASAAAPNTSNAEGIQVRARLLGGPAAAPFGGEAEFPAESEENQLLLIFDLTAPAPLIEANLVLRAKGFQHSKAVTIKGQASAEFRLPAEFNEQKLAYTLTDKMGRVLRRGEADLERLAQEDYVSVRELKLDRAVYAPGEMARVEVVLQGDSSRGYRLEVTANDGSGAVLLQDQRKGVNVSGKSSQEFALELPPEVKAPIFFKFKVYGGQTGRLFDSGQREIRLAQAGNTSPQESRPRPSP
jgi:hypothetical protein